LKEERKATWSGLHLGCMVPFCSSHCKFVVVNCLPFLFRRERLQSDPEIFEEKLMRMR